MRLRAVHFSPEDCLNRIRGSSYGKLYHVGKYCTTHVRPHLLGNPTAVSMRCNHLHAERLRSDSSWSKCGLERWVASMQQGLRFRLAVIQPFLSARKTGIKRQKVNMEKIHWVKRRIIAGNLCRIFLRRLWRMQTWSLLYNVKSPYWSGD